MNKRANCILRRTVLWAVPFSASVFSCAAATPAIGTIEPPVAVFIICREGSQYRDAILAKARQTATEPREARSFMDYAEQSVLRNTVAFACRVATGTTAVDGAVVKGLRADWTAFRDLVGVELDSVFAKVAQRAGVDVISSRLEFSPGRNSVRDLTPELLDVIGATEETRRLVSVVLKHSTAP